MSFISTYFRRHAVEANIQKVLFTRCRNKLLWLFSSALLEDVKDMKNVELAALVNLHCKISCLPPLHVRMMHNLPIALSLGQPVIHVTKLPINLKPENQVFQNYTFACFCNDVSGCVVCPFNILGLGNLCQVITLSFIYCILANI